MWEPERIHQQNPQTKTFSQSISTFIFIVRIQQMVKNKSWIYLLEWKTARECSKTQGFHLRFLANWIKNSVESSEVMCCEAQQNQGLLGSSLDCAQELLICHLLKVGRSCGAKVHSIRLYAMCMLNIDAKVYNVSLPCFLYFWYYLETMNTKLFMIGFYSYIPPLTTAHLPSPVSPVSLSSLLLPDSGAYILQLYLSFSLYPLFSSLVTVCGLHY